MRHVVSATRAAVLALAVACGGGSGSSGEDPPPPKTARELCVELWGASSAKAVECLSWSASSPWADDAAAGMAIGCESVQEGVDAGRLVPDADAAEACIAAYGALTCAKYENHLVTPCDWLAGTIALGGACTSSDECAAGWCDHGSACPGTCAAFVAPGEDCAAARCGPGFVCVGSICVETIPPGAEGEPCGNARAVCEAGLYCAGGTCIPRRTYYEECTGARCTWEFACVPDGASSYCVPVLPEGADCDAFLDPVCIPGTSCDGAKCRADAIPLGAPCPSWAADCADGTCDSSLVCVRWRVAGESCGPDAPCNPYLECVDGACSNLVCWD